jgi:ketosteroid isomerase-like protein
MWRTLVHGMATTAADSKGLGCDWLRTVRIVDVVAMVWGIEVSQGQMVRWLRMGVPGGWLATAHHTSQAPRDVFFSVLRGVTGRQWDTLPDLYAEDTVVEHPMALPCPTRLEGREAIRQHFASARNLPLELDGQNVVIHETTDPEVIVAEFDYAARLRTTGQTFTIHNIFVLRVRDGLIVESRDYANHAVLAAALGYLPQVTAALAE